MSLQFENFNLNKVKIKKDDIVEYEYDESIHSGDGIYHKTTTGKNTVTPHPDFKSLLDELKERLADDFGYLMFKKVFKHEFFNLDKAQEKIVDEFLQEFLRNIKVTGVSWQSSGETIKITGTYNGKAINSSMLYFSNEEFGEYLVNVTDQLKRETYEYIFNGKKAQQEIDFPDLEDE